MLSAFGRFVYDIYGCFSSLYFLLIIVNGNFIELHFFQKHHFAQAVHIINSEGCNILETLPKKVDKLFHVIVGNFFNLACNEIS